MTFDSTQDVRAQGRWRWPRTAPFTRHLEIETYTWDVLPPALKIDLLDSIAREYDWVLETLPCTRPSSLTSSA